MKTLYKHSFVGLVCTIVLLMQTTSETFARTTQKKEFLNQITSSQVTGIEMEGRIQGEEGYMSEVTITVMIDTVEFLTTTSNRSGKCKFTLPLGQKYTIVFSTPGYVSKKLIVNSHVSSSDNAMSTLHFTIDMMKEFKREYKYDRTER